MPPVWLFKLGVVLALLAGCWFHGYHNGTAAVRTKWEAEKAQAVADARTEESRRVMRLQENVDAAYLNQRRAEADARGLRAARDGLLAVAEAAGDAACNPDPAADGQATTARAVVPAELFRSIEERAEQLAGAADSARIAGQLCEGAYRSLTP